MDNISETRSFNESMRINQIEDPINISIATLRTGSGGMVRDSQEFLNEMPEEGNN